MACLQAFHGWIDLCGLWKKQRFSCDRGWAVWEGLSQHQLPLGMRKRGYFSISICLLFPLFFFSVYIFSLLPSFLLPFKHLLSAQHMSFSKAETIVSLQSEGDSWISLFWREHERLKWSQYADIGLNSGYGSALQSLCICVGVWTRLYVLRVRSSTVFFIHAALIEGIGWHITARIKILHRRDWAWYSILAKGEGGEKIEILVLLIAYLWILCTVCPSVMELVNTGYALSCTALPHSSVTHSTALSACSARREAPAGLH